ncbi:MAG: hypothetical protein M1817_002737 [Caeruleum heppii]|nr:MAG: hypothetical protein M1817_002737 [Caeruleum heppii]
MSTTPPPSPQAQAVLIKQAVLSPTTCSCSTVNTLARLLSTKSNLAQNPAPSQKGTGVKRGTTRTSRPNQLTTKRDKPQTTVTVLDSPEDDVQGLSAREKSVLATEIINICLKTLTEAIKLPPKAGRKLPRNSPRLTRSPSSPNVLSRPSPTAKQPLQPRSLNRVSSSPAQSSILRRSSSLPCIQYPGLRAVAECARLAFRCLGSSQSTSKGRLEMPTLQLESGMSALVGKLLALGMEDLALKEIRILKKKLERLLGLQVSSRTPHTSNRVKQQNLDTEKEKESLVDLLRFESVQDKAAICKLVVSTQMQVLKLLATCKTPSVIEFSLEVLQISSPTSPAKLITQSMDQTPGGNKAAQQLNSLSQTILSLCPSVSSTDDAVAINVKSSIRPEIALQFQQLALEIRLLWWKLSGHQGNLEADVLDPFARCLVCFARRSNLAGKEKYELAANVYRRLKDDLDSNRPDQSSIKDAPSASLLKILRQLSILAQEAALFDIAIEQTLQALNAFGTVEAPNASRNIFAVRLTSLRLQCCMSGLAVPQVVDLLGETTAGLRDHVRGEAVDLDVLAMEISAMRRAAVGVLASGTASATSSTDQDCSHEKRFERSCRMLILACVRFLSRYLGPAPGTGATSKMILRYEQRKQVTSKTVMATIDAALYHLRISISTGGVSWELLDATLRDVLYLTSQLETLPTNTYTVKVSNLYWAFVLQQTRTIPLGDPEPSRALLRCVEIARPLPRESRAAALYAGKLERLGNFHLSQNRTTDAISIWREAVVSHVEQGVLDEVVQLVEHTALCRVWDNSAEIVSFGRCLTLFTKTVLRSSFDKNRSCLVDDEAWDLEGRGALLEYQLHVLAVIQDKRTTFEASQSALTAIKNGLFDIYTLELYPLRRIRVLVSLLQLHRDHENLFSLGARDLLELEAQDALSWVVLGKDGQLEKYREHLLAMLQVQLVFLKDQPDPLELKSPLTKWKRLIEGCDSSTSLENCIDDPEAWLAQLLLIVDFLDMKGLQEVRLAALLLVTKAQGLQERPSDDGRAEGLSKLGQQYLRLGYSGKAGLVLAKAQDTIKGTGVTTQTILLWHLCYAEYLLQIGNVDKCEEVLAKSMELAAGESPVQQTDRPATTISLRISRNLLLARTHDVFARISFEKGSLGEALTHAKACVKLNYRAWAGLESRAGRNTAVTPMASHDAETDTLAEGLSSMIISTMVPAMSTTHKALNGSSFWTLVPCLHRGLDHLAQLFLHHGLHREAVYYIEQAQKVVDAVQARPLRALGLAAAGDCWSRSGEFTKGLKLLTQAEELLGSATKNKSMVLVQHYLGNAWGLQGQGKDQLRVYEKAEHILQEITHENFIHRLEACEDNERELENQMASLSIKSTSSTAPKRRAKRATSRPARVKKTVATDPTKTPSPMPSSSLECAEFINLQGTLLRTKAFALEVCRQREVAASLLVRANDLPVDRVGRNQQRLADSKHLLHHGLELMARDSIFCVLRESTVSFPAVAAPNKSQTKRADRGQAPIRTSPARRSPAKTSMSLTRYPVQGDFTTALWQSRDALLEILTAAIRSMSTNAIHMLSSHLGSIVMLLSVATPTKVPGAISPVMAVFAMEVGRTAAIRREREAIEVEKRKPDRDTLLQWPSRAAESADMVPKSPAPEMGRFQRDYIDIIPPHWTAISISLSEDRGELYISKIQAKQPPFILRLPLDRHNSRDADEEVFGFEQARTELREIIDLANFSAHDARDMSRAGAKSAWWAEREALDARLGDLLQNMENMWLGGFRGIFSQQPRRPELLSRFQRTFYNVLDKHLPSRQKSCKKGSRSTRVNLDARILELFVALGNANEEEGCDLDEPLTDLLYFVVDVLQFNGERNAYDEIDFDSIVIETQDALRCYHDAIRAEATDSSGAHTILVLDKALHAIPWESLPCLDGVSVSRLSSLSCLRERIVAQQQRAGAATGGDLNELHVDRSSGAYVLNPGGDLGATQAVFESELARLGEYTSIVQRTPSECEFSTALSTKDIFLYFGHGSGAQYIRSSTIRKLDRCAVTLLMGCSSGSLTECGEFENYGVPVNYGHAGCPALVATLWDVTDKDIDRFSHAALKEWGLFPASSAYPTSSSTTAFEPRSRSKSQARSTDRPTSSKSSTSSSLSRPAKAELMRGQSSLVEAVAHARGSCVLRYLNGAAPVVYGVPVWLSS